MDKQGGFNYFGCKVCNVRGIPYSSETLTVHLQTKNHKFLKILYDNGMWPGPAEKYECSERRIQIYKFLDTRGTLLCEICNKIVPDSMTLFQHQQSDEHRKLLKDKNLDVPMVYICDVCDVMVCGLENYYSHCWSVEHHNATEEQKKSLEKEIEDSSKVDLNTTINTATTSSNGCSETTFSTPLSNADGANGTDLALSDISASCSSASFTDSHLDDVLNNNNNNEVSVKSQIRLQQEVAPDFGKRRVKITEKAVHRDENIGKCIADENHTITDSKSVDACPVVTETNVKSNFDKNSTIVDDPIQKQLSILQNFDEQKLKDLLANLKDNNNGEVKFVDFAKSKSGQQVAQQSSTTSPQSDTNVFELLEKSLNYKNNSVAATPSVENTLLSTLSRLVSWPSQQQQRATSPGIVPTLNLLMDQQKKDALNRLKCLLEIYIEKETLRLQQEHKKLMDIVQVKMKIQVSQENGKDMPDMSISNIVQMTETIAGRLSLAQYNDLPSPSSPHTEPNITGGNFVQQRKQPYGPALPSPADNATNQALTIDNALQNVLLTAFAGKLPVAAAAALANPNIFMPNNEINIRPRFVNTDELFRHSILNLLSVDNNNVVAVEQLSPTSASSGGGMSRSRSPSPRTHRRRNNSSSNHHHPRRSRNERRSSPPKKSRSPAVQYYYRRSRSRSKSSSRSRRYYHR